MKFLLVTAVLFLHANVGLASSEKTMSMICSGNQNFTRISEQSVLSQEASKWIFKTSPSDIKIEVVEGLPIIGAILSSHTLTITISGTVVLLAHDNNSDFLKSIKEEFEKQIKEATENGKIVVDWTSVEILRIHAPEGYYPDHVLPFINASAVFVNPTTYAKRITRIKASLDQIQEKLNSP